MHEAAAATVVGHPGAGAFGTAVSFVDGVRVLGDGRELAVVDPYTGVAIGTVREAGDSLLDSAVASASSSLEAWSAYTPADRCAVLRGVADAIDELGESMATTVSCEMGMPISLARVTQWTLPAAVLRAALAAAGEVQWRQRIEGAELHRRAAGVVAAISPWNMPVYQIMTKLAGALVAGCPVVVKPSVQTPFDALRLVELMHEAGLPAGVLNLVQGAGSRTGGALAAHPGVAHVSFTGSVEAGRSVAASAARVLARCTLELGGKSPAVMLPDADFARAVPSALASGLVNAGQACNATTRMLVPADRMVEAEELLVSAAAAMPIGDPLDSATVIGPMSSAAHGEAVLGFVQRAIADGARVVTGGPTALEVGGAGVFVAPTVLAGLPITAEAVQEEIFGPVVVVLPYTDVDDALRIAHASRFGLSAEVWGPHDDAVRFAGRLRVGQVKVNGVRTRERPAVPFGGSGESGYGRELGTLGIEEFTDVTAVMA